MRSTHIKRTKQSNIKKQQACITTSICSLLETLTRVHIVLFSAVKQIHCAHVTCDSEWVTVFFARSFNIQQSGVLTALFGVNMVLILHFFLRRILIVTLWPAVGDPLFVDWLCSCHVACMHARFVITGIFCVPVSKTRAAGLRSTWLLAMATLTSSSGWPLQGGMTLTWRPPLATLPLTWLLWMDTSTLSLWVSVLLLKMWKTSQFYPYVSAIAHLVDHSTENLGTMLMQVWVPGAARVFSPGVNFQCRLFLTVPIHPCVQLQNMPAFYVNTCAHIFFQYRNKWLCQVSHRMASDFSASLNLHSVLFRYAWKQQESWEGWCKWRWLRAKDGFQDMECSRHSPWVSRVFVCRLTGCCVSVLVLCVCTGCCVSVLGVVCTGCLSVCTGCCVSVQGGVCLYWVVCVCTGCCLYWVLCVCTGWCLFALGVVCTGCSGCCVSVLGVVCLH